ncbi:unnamed protein product [Orchesella dallaii]|uniref:KEN domain-containing protein n=1 Tax=Orchesella dallaii TaxID=48710 RepID=A0ABP1PLD1_9HEXA
MTSNNSARRPPASAILKHHIFWSKEKNLNFLVDISNRTKTPSVRSENCIKSLERRIKLFCGPFPTWFSHLCPVVSKYLTTKFGIKQKDSTIMDLIRLFRNMHNHISEQDVPQDVKNAIGLSPSAFFDYWITRFPFLVSATWIVFQPLKKLQDYGLAHYYPDRYNFEFTSIKK